MKHVLDILHQKLTKLIDLIDVPMLFFGSYTLGQWKDLAGLIGIGVTVAYTLWKWRKEWKEVKINK